MRSMVELLDVLLADQTAAVMVSHLAHLKANPLDTYSAGLMVELSGHSMVACLENKLDAL